MTGGERLDIYDLSLLSKLPPGFVKFPAGFEPSFAERESSGRIAYFRVVRIEPHSSVNEFQLVCKAAEISREHGCVMICGYVIWIKCEGRYSGPKRFIVLVQVVISR